MRIALRSRPDSGTSLFIPVHHFNFAPRPIRVTRVFRCCASAAVPEPGPRWRILAAVITVKELKGQYAQAEILATGLARLGFMKGNHNDKLRIPAQTGEGARPFISRCSRGVLAVLGATLLVLLANGCASVASSGDYDPCHYNPNTGAPHWGMDD